MPTQGPSSAVIAFSTGAWRTEPVWRSLEYARTHGFQGIELSFCYPDNGLYRAGALIPDVTECRQIRDLTKTMRVSVHGPVVPLAADDPLVSRQAEADLAKSLEAAHLVGAEVMVVHLRQETSAYQESAHAAAVRVLPALERLATIAAQVDVRLGLENVGFEHRHIDYDYEMLVRLVDELAHPYVGLTLDTGHAHVHSDVCGGVGTTARLFHPRVIHYHLHDNDGSKDSHSPLGHGTVDFTSLSPFMVGYTGIIALEVFPSDRPMPRMRERGETVPLSEFKVPDPPIDLEIELLTSKSRAEDLLLGRNPEG